MNSRAAIKAFVPLTFIVAAIVLAIAGTGSEGTRLALRVTARMAFVLFLAAFTARPLLQLAPGRATRWLMQQRSLIGVCFGLTMSIHAALIIRLFLLARPEWPAAVQSTDITIGIPGLAFVLAMVITSHPQVRRSLHGGLWRLLHTAGAWLVWFIFIACLMDSMTAKARHNPSWQYWPFIALLVAAAALRLLAGGTVMWTRRNRLAMPAGGPREEQQ